MILAALFASLVVGDPPAPAVQPVVATPKQAEAAASNGITGRWQGPVAAGAGSLFVLVEARLGPSGEEVTIIAPGAGAMRARAGGVIAHDRSLSFTLESRGVSGRFRGEVSADGKTYTGTLQLGKAGANTDEVPFTLVGTPDPKTASKSTRWEGKLDLPQGNMQLPLAFTIAQLGADEAGDESFAGVVDIPMQNVEGLPVLVTRGPGDERGVRWKWLMPGPPEAVLDLSQVDGDTLRGTFNQGKVSLPIELKKSVGASTVALKRPQQPQPPFPYRVEDVAIKHRFGHTLAGTLTLPQRTPDSPAKFPAVVLVSGSGPQDRDETLLGHKPFLVIADALTRAGIAVLRYDDRGTAGSTGNFDSATTYDFAIDADEASEWLKKHDEIDATRVGIVGHSEGGLIAPIVAVWQWSANLGSPTPVAFIVLLAGPGVNGKNVLMTQMRRILAGSGVANEKIDPIVQAQAALLDASITTGKSAADITSLARDLVKLQLAIDPKPMTDADIDAAATAAAGQVSNPWMRTFLIVDPAAWIPQLQVPVLAMNGSLDTQVDTDQNLSAIEAESKLGGVALTAKRYQGLNHLFQPATKGTPDEYANIETTFDPAALKDLVDWIVARGKEPPPTRRNPGDAIAKPPEQRPDGPAATPKG